MSVAPVARLDGLAWAALIALGTLWGTSFVLVEVLLTALPVFTIVALRVAIAAACLWMWIALFGGAPPVSRAIWAKFAVLGFFNNAVPFVLIVTGQTAITAGLASILNATTPIFTALLAAVVLADERLTRARLAGLVLGLAGVAVMMGPSAFGGDAAVVGMLAVLGGALSYAIAAVFARRFALTGLPPVAIAAGQTTMSSAILVPVALLVDDIGAIPMPSPAIWLAIVVNGALITAFAYILYFTVLRRAGATNAALVTVIVPAVAVVIGILALGEVLLPFEAAGLCLIVAGLLVVDGRIRLP